MITLYQLEECSECRQVRTALGELQSTYVSVCVPAQRPERTALVKATGQPSVPAMVDGETVLVGPEAIIEYVRNTAGRRPNR